MYNSNNLLWQDRKWENIPDFILLNENSVFIVGQTFSMDFPVTANAINQSLNGESDVCLSHLMFTDTTTTTTDTSTTTTSNGTRSSFLLPLLLILGMTAIERRKRR